MNQVKIIGKRRKYKSMDDLVENIVDVVPHPHIETEQALVYLKGNKLFEHRFDEEDILLHSFSRSFKDFAYFSKDKKVYGVSFENSSEIVFDLETEKSIKEIKRAESNICRYQGIYEQGDKLYL